MDETPHSQRDTTIRQQRALVEVAESIAAHRDLSSLLLDLRQRLRQFVKFGGVQIVLYDPKANIMRRHFLGSQSGEDLNLISELQIEEAPAGLVWQTQQSLLITDPADFEERYPRIIAELRQFGIESVYLIPLTSLGRRLGTIVFMSRQPGGWTEDDQELLQQITKLVAIAVDNVINLETAHSAQIELKRRLDHQHLLLDVAKNIGSNLDLRDLIRAIADCLRTAIHCDGVWMTLYDESIGQMRVYALDPQLPDDSQAAEGRLIEMENTPAGDAIKTKKTIFVTREYLETSTNPVVQEIYKFGVRSGCTAPLLTTHGKALGAISMVSRQENSFSEEDAELLTLIAQQIAIAVENSLNYGRALTAENVATRQSERLQLLLDINNAVVSNLDLDSLMKAIWTSLRKVFPLDACGLGLYDAEAGQLRSYANILINDRNFIQEGQLIPLEGSVPGLVFTSGKPLILDRFDDERLNSDWSKQFRAAGFKSGGSVPLVAHGRKLGTLGLATRNEYHSPKTKLLCSVRSGVR
jgi:formate hydrogenlyase transcriptional activator